jgi:RHS repeat-associated protein
VNATDPFGMIMPNRSYSASSDYRFGFNGKENDNEVKGEGNEQDYGMRIYDPRVGRFLSIDPINKKYPELTPYQFASNSPIWGVDQDGLEIEIANWIFDTYLDFKYGDPTGVHTLMNGAVEKARIENGDVSYHNQNVPTRVQKILDQQNTKEANAKVIKGGIQVTKFTLQTSADIATLMLPAGEATEVGFNGLRTLFKASPEAKAFASKFAETIFKNTPKAELPRAITAVLDKTTGRVYYGRSGVLKSIEELEPTLKEMIPKESLEKWIVTNCAECDALNSALKGGAKVEDLEMHTLKIDKKTGTVSDFERCQNCKVTTKNVKTTSDPKKKG